MRRPSPAVARGVGALVVVALTVVAVVALVTTRGDDPAPPPDLATLAQLARADVVVPRGPFCDGVRVGAAEAALAGQVAQVRDYANGDTARLDPATEDVAHEFGCTWTSITGTTARAWVFAPPVTPGRAKRLARLVTHEQGCADSPAQTDDPGFGASGAAFTCTTDGLVSAGRAGLFGDAWLTCTVAEPVDRADAADLQARADRWCVAAAVGAARPDPR